MKRFLIIALFIGSTFPAWAKTTMDSQTYGVLIEKLEGVNSKAKLSDVSRFGIKLRLADLYAERARRVLLEKEDNQCKDCPSPYRDRIKSLNYYNQIFEEPSLIEHRGRMLLQMAHLYEVTDQLAKAKNLYQNIISGKVQKLTKDINGLAHVGLGDLHYKDGQFGTAKTLFTKALSFNIDSAGYTASKIAWCYFNLGDAKSAVNWQTKILQSESYLSRSTSSGLEVDESIHMDAARDLATFLAQTPVTKNDVVQLFNLSPEDHKLDNVSYLAEELERLGKTPSSLIAWRYYLENQPHTSRKLKALVYVAKVQLVLNREQSALGDMTEAAQIWQKTGCQLDADECKELQDQFRQTIIDWNQRRKNKPSPYLVKAYELFTKTFPKDIDMIYWAAQTAKKRRDYAQSAQFFRQTSDLARQLLSDNSDSVKIKNIAEGSLLGEVEMAEASKDSKLKTQAYENYLKHSTKKEKQFEVSYQLAYMDYEKRDYKTAADKFYKLAVDTKLGSSPLKKKSADLALDSLAALKKEDTLSEWADQFSRVFPAAALEFRSIARKSRLNLVAVKLNDEKSEKSEYKEAQSHLAKVSLQGSSDKEKIAYYKNKTLLALKLDQLNEVNDAASGLLSLKGLSKNDHLWAQKQQLIVAQKQKRFRRAYQLAKKINDPALNPEQKSLQLALLADLANINSKKHYLDFIKYTNSYEKANQARAHLILKSRYPWNELKKELSSLKKTPELLGRLALEVYAKYRNQVSAELIIKQPGVTRYAAGRSLQRQLVRPSLVAKSRRIESHRVSTKSDYLLKKTLKQHIDLLKDLETETNKIIALNDWILQIIALNKLAEQNNRLAEIIEQLPVPRGLSDDENAKYKGLLAQQAQPFKTTNDSIRKKLDQFWNNQSTFEAVIENYKSSPRPIKNLMKPEMQELAKYAPFFKRQAILSAIKNNDEGQSLEHGIQARANPLDGRQK
ncbi:MAG: hypothetical protein H6626_01565 [Pseudobdellovibrionaceae bacterium]|nr:hypothetical protein [Bdellovibrionales bacterium]USN47807.1 MAG: hypothetical protein H6626_01565 [Pseudobdellovibrionaceae bacterium]